VRENLFTMGAAKAVEDEEAIALAMKTPGTPVALSAVKPLRGKRRTKKARSAQER
jgi:hypothetical protein